MDRTCILRPKEWLIFLDSKTCKRRGFFSYKFQLNTGARFNEMMNVKVRDVDINNHNIL